MDHRRFDSLTQALATARTRRAVLAGLGALLLGWRGASATTACPPGQLPNRKGDCSCPPGTYACPDGCFDKKHDVTNCGDCGNVCLPGEACRKGECRCPAGATCAVPTTTTAAPTTTTTTTPAPTTTTTTTAAPMDPPAVCTTGTDALSGAHWVVCRADADTAWISHNDPGTGGTYHPIAICQSLGYAGYDLFGGTCSNVCGWCQGPNTCSNPGVETYQGGDDCGEVGGDQLCTYVMWRCTNLL